ncbi:MAG TPA: chloramphenicol phosphotransferase, partial [Devosia sp.]
TIVAHARQGFDVVADFGHHDSYSKPLGILQACARRLMGLNVWFVGVRCPLEIIMARRNADPQNGFYLAGEGIPQPVQRWQDAVHEPGIYDLELDTGALTPEQCAGRIREALEAQALPTAFRRLAAL